MAVLVQTGVRVSRQGIHRGWYSRGYLPHFDESELVQMITFRLADSLPADVLSALQEVATSQTDGKAVRWHRLDSLLDTHYGACHLRDPRIARLVEDAFFYFDGIRYHLLAWVIMPNHLHVLIGIKPGFPLAGVLHSWKSFTAKRANRILGRTGPFWQAEFFDRYIRDEKHLEEAIHYIHNNPVKAGLVAQPEDWPYSSAVRMLD
jgi:REP element-mobilizing transposase RayT